MIKPYYAVIGLENSTMQAVPTTQEEMIHFHKLPKPIISSLLQLVSLCSCKNKHALGDFFLIITPVTDVEIDN